MGKEKLTIYIKLYQLLKFLYKAVGNFKREYKYTLGQSLLDLNWKCLDLVVEANSLPNRAKHKKIKRLSMDFDKLKLRLRMAEELNLLSAGQFAHLHTYFVEEAGEMIGGWLNWAKSYG